MTTFRPLEYANDGTMARCEYLIRRFAPELMRCGGGPVRNENLRGGIKLSEEERAEMVRRRLAGEGLEAIALAMKRSMPTVGRVCQAAGVKRKRCARRLSAEALARMRELARMNWSDVAIAADIGCSASAVFMRLRHVRRKAA